MKLKGFDQYINESNEFKPIDVEMFEAETPIKESDVDWMEIIFNSFPTLTEKTNILRSINSLKWEPVGGSKPMGPGLAIQSTIKEFKIPKVDLIAYGGTPFGSDDEPDASYSAFGIQGHYSNGTYRIFFVDGGNVVIPIGSIRTDVKESVNESTEGKLEKFLSQFPDDAKNWSQATDEIRDTARMAREVYTELDFDMLHDEYETNPKAPQPLDFEKLKTPTEWNTKGKAYILDTFDKMSDKAKTAFMEQFNRMNESRKK